MSGLSFRKIAARRKKTIQKTVLNNVFEVLKNIGAVRSEREFSKGRLCRRERYMRTPCFKCGKLNVGTLAICANELQQYER